MSSEGTAFLCMRTTSNKPFVLADGSVGHIHYVKGEAHVPRQLVRQERQKPSVNLEEWYNATASINHNVWKEQLAKELGVSYSSLLFMGALWSANHQAWAFPMRDGLGKIVGIRIRWPNGNKKAITGSKNALFIPRDEYRKQRVYLFEGPTDTCAAVTIGLKAIGRPSCSAGLFDIITFIKQNQVKELVIVCDSDKPGLDGAAALVQHLPIRSVVITPPAKDMRDFLKNGGTASMLEAMADAMVWNQPLHSTPV